MAQTDVYQSSAFQTIWKTHYWQHNVGLWAKRPSNRGSIRVRIKTLFFFSEAYTHAPISMRTRGSFSPGVKRPGREVDHSPTASAEVKKVWSYTSPPSMPSFRKQRRFWLFLCIRDPQIFQKSSSDLQNSSCQRIDTTQVPYWRPTILKWPPCYLAPSVWYTCTDI